jgi:hypothetical protein
MSRAKSQRKQIARNLAKYTWLPMIPVARGEKGVNWPAWCTRVYWNNRFTAMVDDSARTTRGPAIKVYVEAHACGRDVFWKDLQRIKNEIFGPQALAVQYYPRESELVDVVNVYWLFVYPDGWLPEPIVERRA